MNTQTEKELLVRRSYKEVYHMGDSIVKIFSPDHPKSAVFNEALNIARIEESGLPIAGVIKEVKQVDGKWSLVIQYTEGKTLGDVMKEDPENFQAHLSNFVELQLMVHDTSVENLNSLKDKLTGQINRLKILNATQRYDLLARLESMPVKNQICHGDFNPENVIIGIDGKVSIIDWAHVTQGNPLADAAMTYLILAIADPDVAETYLDIYCEKSDTARQQIQQWLPIVAAAQLEKDDNKLEKEFLLNFILGT